MASITDTNAKRVEEIVASFSDAFHAEPSHSQRRMLAAGFEIVAEQFAKLHNPSHATAATLHHQPGPIPRQPATSSPLRQAVSVAAPPVQSLPRPVPPVPVVAGNSGTATSRPASRASRPPSRASRRVEASSTDNTDAAKKSRKPRSKGAFEVDATSYSGGAIEVALVDVDRLRSMQNSFSTELIRQNALKDTSEAIKDREKATLPGLLFSDTFGLASGERLNQVLYSAHEIDMDLTAEPSNSSAKCQEYLDENDLPDLLRNFLEVVPVFEQLHAIRPKEPALAVRYIHARVRFFQLADALTEAMRQQSGKEYMWVQNKSMSMKTTTGTGMASILQKLLKEVNFELPNYPNERKATYAHAEMIAHFGLGIIPFLPHNLHSVADRIGSIKLGAQNIFPQVRDAVQPLVKDVLADVLKYIVRPIIAGRRPSVLPFAMVSDGDTISELIAMSRTTVL